MSKALDDKYRMLRVYKEDIEKLKEYKFDFRVTSMTDALSKLIKAYEKQLEEK